eukprot:GILK01010539.1.p1 GENE.GILK01010539.1~~GILK01010539.1.p1  ORF type:complete len:272 (+),score=18.19 GILK01010539.1:66-881(+)
MSLGCTATVSHDEWFGSTPFKWSEVHTGRKRMGQSATDALRSESAPPFFCAMTTYGIEVIKGQKHFDPKVSEARAWRPSLRQFPDRVTPEVRLPKVVQKLAPCNATSPRPSGVKLFPPRPTGEGSYFNGGLKTIYLQDGSRAQDKFGSEINLDKKMGQHRRVRGIEESRNHIPSVKPGDKQFANPEYSPDYFKTGGSNLPGTTFVLDKSQKKQKLKDALSSRSLTRRTFREAEAARRIRDEHNSVIQLQSWELSVLKDSDPKYVDPDEDER